MLSFSRAFLVLVVFGAVVAPKGHSQSGTPDDFEVLWRKLSGTYDGAAPAAPAPPAVVAGLRGEPGPFRLQAPPLARAGLDLGIDLKAMDPAVRPQDDFFRYVNGAWLKSFEIPADKRLYGAFMSLRDRADADVRRIIEESSSASGSGEDRRQIADLYASFMNIGAIEAAGLRPMEDALAEVRGLRSKEDLVEAFARATVEGVRSPVGVEVGQDDKDPDQYAVFMRQSGLGLPEREYYFKEGERPDRDRALYVEYVAKLLSLVGEREAERKARAVFDLEKMIAEHHWKKEDVREADKIYNKMTVSELEALAPGFDWRRYLLLIRIPQEHAMVVVAQPSYFAGLVKVLDEQPLESWKLYLLARTLSDAAPFLSGAFERAAFEYRGRGLGGQPEMEPRWQRGVRFVNGSVGELVGRAYVQKHFPEDSKRRVERMVENLRQAYAERIQGLDWMSGPTKARALEKVRKFTPKIGYPDKWKDYTGLEIKPDDLMGNRRRIQELEYGRMVERLGRPVDRQEWFMPPQTVNAYFNPNMNEIVFPAAILQPPFFNPQADDAVNYGAIGAVIGHEMGHGFDDQGSKYDGDGRLRDWWTPEDLGAFEARTRKLVAQYDAFEPLPGLHLNGRNTQGENIGDLGGLTVAHHAYRLSLQGREAPALEGFSGSQRFFLGYGQVWRSKYREQALRFQVAVDPHSPPEYRVNGVLPNMPEFYEAFGVKPGDKLFLPPEERVSIW